ncbi:hypothetical protein PybrP1_008377 [[Pythium] brassicae (nom. inval.)]|nr:hypothetical protein PybrP1_008377 [[Pythium] brassicae (nom. inval.)]
MIEIAQATDAQLAGSPHFTPAHRSLMAKHLTREVYARLKTTTPSAGYTLDRAVQTSVDNPHLGVGVTAGDEESYHVFNELFDPVIEG